MNLCDWIDERAKLLLLCPGSEQFRPQLQAVDGLQDIAADAEGARSLIQPRLLKQHDNMCTAAQLKTRPANNTPLGMNPCFC
jgi:hypothetical protein